MSESAKYRSELRLGSQSESDVVPEDISGGRKRHVELRKSFSPRHALCAAHCR